VFLLDRYRGSVIRPGELTLENQTKQVLLGTVKLKMVLYDR